MRLWRWRSLRLLANGKWSSRDQNMLDVDFFLSASQANDVEYMFKNIWDSHSALSEESDIYSLTFVRWNRREEFSPWNCILLTLQEAIAHLKLEDAEGVTTDSFLSHTSICFVHG